MTFAVILSAMALPTVLTSESNLEVILYIFVFNKVQEAALNQRSVFKTHLKVHQSSCFRSVEGRESSSPERFEDSVHYLCAT